MRLSPANVPYYQHIWIVPMPRPSERAPFVLCKSNAAHAAPGVPDVIGGAPGICQPRQFGGLCERRRIREAKHDVPPAGAQSLCHFLRLRYSDRIPIIFKIVYAPFSPLLRVIVRE